MNNWLLSALFGHWPPRGELPLRDRIAAAVVAEHDATEGEFAPTHQQLLDIIKTRVWTMIPRARREKLLRLDAAVLLAEIEAGLADGLTDALHLSVAADISRRLLQQSCERCPLL